HWRCATLLWFHANCFWSDVWRTAGLFALLHAHDCADQFPFVSADEGLEAGFWFYPRAGYAGMYRCSADGQRDHPLDPGRGCYGDSDTHGRGGLDRVWLVQLDAAAYAAAARNQGRLQTFEYLPC